MTTFYSLTVSYGYAGYGNVAINSNYEAVTINSIGSYPLQFQMDNNPVVGIGPSGVAIGYNTNPATRQLDVASYQPDVARFYGGLNYTDNGVRLTTDQSNSSIGLILEQRSADSAGGIRIDNAGNVSIHAGESMDAQLSTSTARIVVLPTGRIGMNTETPQNMLHVVGGIRTTAYSDIDPFANTIPTVNIDVVLDTWLNIQYRTAKYIVQITDPVSGNIDISEVLLAHSNGVGHFTVYNNVNSNGSLGTIGYNINGDLVNLTLNNNIAGVIVKVSVFYITI